MKLILFLSLISAVSFIAGWYFLISLTVNPVKIFLSVFIFTLLLSFDLLIIVLAIREGYIALPLIMGVIFFLSGYLINTKIFLSQRDSLVKGDLNQGVRVNKGHTAIVYFTHGEPETYNPIGWLNQFREFDEQGVRFIPFFARPVFVFMLRKKYLEVGKSNHRQGHLQMLAKLEDSYRREGDTTTRFYISFLDDYPRLDSAVIQALIDGADRIVVTTVFLTMSNHTAEGRKIVEKLDCKNKYGVDVKFTEPLWNSETLMRAFIDKVYNNIGNTPKEKVAVALIGHGQPDEWDKEWPTLTEQETRFREKIIELLVTEGFRRENLGNAWMEFKDPKPVDLMKSFVNNRVGKVLYFASSISADAIHSQYDIPDLVNKYPFPDNIEVINLGAWNAHPLVIKAIRERIDIRLSEPDSTKKESN